MEVVAIIILTIILLLLAGVTIYFIVDYMKFKDTTDDSIDSAKKDIAEEGTRRISNLKYVVEQVNTVNDSIFNEVQNNSNFMLRSVNTLNSNQTKTLNGIDAFFKFTSNVGSPSNITLFDLPGFVAPDVKLMKHLTAVSGMTITDINSSNNFMICNRDSPAKCIKFPDNNGDTYLTSFSNNSKIVLDSTGGIDLNGGAINLRKGGSNYAYIDATGNDTLFSATSNMFIRVGQTGKVGIATDTTTPSAMLHVTSKDATMPPFKASTLTNTVEIDGQGVLKVNKIQIGGATIESSGAANNTLKVTAAGGVSFDNTSITIPSTSRILLPSGQNVGFGTVPATS